MRLCKAFANGSSANIELWKTPLYKIGQSEGFLGILLRPLLKTGLPLMKNVNEPLANDWYHINSEIPWTIWLIDKNY